MNYDEITLGPYIVVFLEVSAKVTLAFDIIPEFDRHIGECGCGNKFAWRTMGHFLPFDSSTANNLGVINLNLYPERNPLGTTNI